MHSSRRFAAAALFNVVFVCTVGLLALAARTVSAQDEPPPVRPGPEHAILGKLVGTWDATIHSRTAEGEDSVANGSETRRLACGGLWLISDFRGEFGGQPFEGHGATGYDPHEKKYVGTWVDSMSSSLTLSTGTFDEKTRTFSFEHTGVDPSSGEKVVMTAKQVIEDDDHHTTSFYTKGPDGSDLETFRIEYTRKGAPPRKKADPLAEVVGTWKLKIKYQEDGDPLDYDLRITRSGEGLKGVLVSPRSGEHPFKSVELKDGVLRMAIVRNYDGNEVELRYEGKLAKKELAGKVTFAGVDGFSGSWTGSRK